LLSKVDFSDLDAFIVVAQDGSFSAAAKKLNISPSALSRRIQKLETALNVKLFARTTREVKLTPIGRQLLVRSQELVKGFEEMILALQDKYSPPATRVVVACVPSATKTHLIGAFQLFAREHPNIHLNIVDTTGNEVMDAIQDREADFGINYLGQEDSTVDFEPVLRDEFVVATRLDGMFGDRPNVRWDEISEIPVIAAWKGAGIRILMDAELARRKIRIRCSHEVKHIDTSIELVHAGAGIAIVPRLVFDRQPRPDLRPIRLVDPVISRSIGLIKLRGKRLRPPAAMLWDMLLSLPRPEPV
jgi:DNA-binding transcriptional LysR family regulator